MTSIPWQQGTSLRWPQRSGSVASTKVWTHSCTCVCVCDIFCKLWRRVQVWNSSSSSSSSRPGVDVSEARKSNSRVVLWDEQRAGTFHGHSQGSEPTGHAAAGVHPGPAGGQRRQREQRQRGGWQEPAGRQQRGGPGTLLSSEDRERGEEGFSDSTCRVVLSIVLTIFQGCRAMLFFILLLLFVFFLTDGYLGWSVHHFGFKTFKLFMIPGDR